MRIFDCFTFYNELDLLELRLRELYDKVDHFVIVEATTTFTNRAKPLYFDLNRKRYSEWADKIRHIVVDLPQSTNAWDNETAQRDTIIQGCLDREPNDIVIVTDVDEILRPDAVDKLRASEQTLWPMRMPVFNFKFNYMRVTPGEYDVWGMAARASTFDEITPNSLRGMRFQFAGLPYGYNSGGIEIIEHAGWHFGYLGNNEYLRDKAQSFSHTEVNTPEFLEHIDIDQSIAERKEWDRNQANRYEIVELDNYFPRTLLDRQLQYQQFILDNPVKQVHDILP